MNFSEILNLFRQGKTGAKSHMKNLIEMAAVDGDFNDVEYDLLKSIARRNNISESQLKEIRKNPHHIAFEVPKDKTEKFNQLYDLIHMMSIDKNIHQEELKLCDLFAVKFGYPRDNIKSIIESVRLNIQHGNDSREAMKRVAMIIED
ncbi:MAG: hypothetical protein ACOYXT_20860 [Bacteroidota bacterium]